MTMAFQESTSCPPFRSDLRAWWACARSGGCSFRLRGRLQPGRRTSWVRAVCRASQRITRSTGGRGMPPGPYVRPQPLPFRKCVYLFVYDSPPYYGHAGERHAAKACARRSVHLDCVLPQPEEAIDAATPFFVAPCRTRRPRIHSAFACHDRRGGPAGRDGLWRGWTAG
jgi:hypothetical protein